MAAVQKKTALITGCSTGGIGWAMAKVFRKRDYHVFATVRDVSKAADLAELSEVEVLELDVTAAESISRCKATITQRTGGKLDALVNLAGEEAICPLLDVDVSEARRMYDVNVWGPLAMIQAFAPLLVGAKGVVANQSSIDAALSPVWAGIYASSRAASARMSEVFRVELEPLGVRVVTMMCGSTDTPMFDKEGGQMNLSAASYYNGIQNAAQKERKDHRGKAMKVDVLAEKLVKDILGGAKGQIWHGAYATMVRYMTWMLPASYVDSLVNAERGIKDVKRR